MSIARSGREAIHKTRGASLGGTGIPPIWKESLWPADWLALRMSPVYYGHGVPHGDRSPVIVVPGFLCTDAHMYELYMWLSRVGYRPYLSGIGLNAQCPGKLARTLSQTVRRAHAETGRAVRIVGHSLGGILARRVSIERADLVSQLIYLGSPLQAVHAHPAVVATASVVHSMLAAMSLEDGRCLTERCPCGFTRDFGLPLPKGLSHAAIYTTTDGVVDWHDSTEMDPALNHEVGGTHMGLVCNPRAYRVLGELLAAA